MSVQENEVLIKITSAGTIQFRNNLGNLWTSKGRICQDDPWKRPINC